MRIHTRLVACLAIGAALFAAGCGKKADDSSPLAFVPADTPYVFANLEPMPDAVVARYRAHTQAVWPIMVAVLERAVASLEEASGKMQSAATPEDASPATTANAEIAKSVRVLKAILAELHDRDTPEKWREAGVGMQVRSAFYGIGVLPVLRVEILDADALRAMIARIEQKAGVKLPTARIGDQEVWTFSGHPWRGLAAIEGKHLVIGLIPGNADEALERRVLGLDRPAKNLADTGALADFDKARGYLPFGSGWIDLRRLLALFEDDPAVAAFAQEMNLPKPALDAVCRSELDAMLAKTPRMTAGFTRLDAERMDMQLHLDLDPALAKSLAALPAALPGAASNEALFDFALALPVLRGRDFLLAQANAILASPYRCGALESLNDGAETLKTQLDRTIPPPLPDLLGLRMTVDHLTLPNAASGTPLETAGRSLIASNNPAFLVSLVQMVTPDLQKTAIPADGKAVTISLPDILGKALPNNRMANSELFVAMTAKTLGIAIGQGQAAKLEAAVAATPQAPGTLLQLDISGDFYKLIADAYLDPDSGVLATAALSAEQRDMLAMQRQLYMLYAQWIKRAGSEIRVNAEGIDFIETVESAK